MTDASESTSPPNPLSSKRRGGAIAAMLPDQHLPYYPTLWRGTLVLNAVLVGLCLALRPAWVWDLMSGMAIGVAYLGSLQLTGQPRYRYMQIGFSLIRMILFALAIVVVSKLNLMKTLIVIAGCFSYKWVLVGWMTRETLHSLQLQQRSRPPHSASADPRDASLSA
ncbi:MAG: hypothetical protein AB7P76_08755 [Candidatus Melainabacteria bacterium]